MHAKLDRDNPFGHGGKTYAAVETAEKAALAKLEKMPDYPGTTAMVIVTPVDVKSVRRYAPRIVFQGREAAQAAIHGAHFTGFRCFA